MNRQPDGSFVLTDEEIDQLIKEFENAITDFDPYTIANGSSTYYNWDDPVWDSNPPKFNRTSHEWKPVLLLSTTVWNCKHCGIKKEDSKSWYCEDEQEEF